MKFILLVLFLISSFSYGQESKLILSKYIDAIGGDSLVNSINNVHFTGTLTFDSVEKKFDYILGKPYKFRYTFIDSVENIITSNCFDGKNSYASRNNILTEGLIRPIKESPFPIFNSILFSNKDLLRSLGDTVIENKLYKKVFFQDFQKKVDFVYFFDFQTGQISIEIRVNQYDGKEVRIEYSKFTSQDGFVFPAITETIIEGIKTTRVIKNLKYNLDIPDVVFRCQ